MHMRTKKWARPELGQCPYYCEMPVKTRGHWRECFSTDRPLHMELGCGKGVSTAQMVYANRHEINYLALEISKDVLGDARRNLVRVFGDEPIENVQLVQCDISWLRTFVAPEDRIGRIYIHFCNPWPRPKHAKRRLTHPRQLLQYRDVLQENGEIWFKTDDDDLFRDSLTYFEVCGFEQVYMTGDLHQSGFEPNYISEHERKFSAQGIPIKFGIFRKKPEYQDSAALRYFLRQADTPLQEDDDPEDSTE